jgi:hypothetical protein
VRRGCLEMRLALRCKAIRGCLIFWIPPKGAVGIGEKRAGREGGEESVEPAVAVNAPETSVGEKDLYLATLRGGDAAELSEAGQKTGGRRGARGAA